MFKHFGFFSLAKYEPLSVGFKEPGLVEGVPAHGRQVGTR